MSKLLRISQEQMWKLVNQSELPRHEVTFTVDEGDTTECQIEVVCLRFESDGKYFYIALHDYKIGINIDEAFADESISKDVILRAIQAFVKTT